MKHLKPWLVVGMLLSAFVSVIPAHALSIVTVGNHPACDHTSIKSAIGQPDASLGLKIIVQGRPADDDGSQQGIYDADLTIIGRTVEILGDDGSNPLSTCTSSNAARRPEIRGLASSDAGFKVVAQDGATLVLNDINIRSTFAGGIQITDSRLAAARVDFLDNQTPAGVSGAAIQADSSDLDIRNAVFRRNTSPAAGGAIFCTAGTTAEIFARDVQFGAASNGNRAGFDGGVIALHRNCAFETTGGVIFEGNFAGRDGGAIAAAPDSGNRINLRDEISFGVTQGNVALRNGGAIALGAQSVLQAEDTLSLFNRNFAGQAGGALHVAEGARALLLGCEQFFENEADTGGAIHAEGIVTVRNLEKTLTCDPPLDQPPNRYQTMFDSNLSTAGRGGAVFASGAGAIVRIEQAALVGNDSTLSGTTLPPLGSVAYVENGARLHIENSLIWANGHESTVLLQDPPTLLQADDTGSRIDVGLTTVVENIGSVPLIVTGGASARLFGVIEHDNDMFSPSVGGEDILSVCSTMDVDLDPEFVPPPGTHRGLFRLAPGSPMRGFCPAGDAPFAMHFDGDLDDVPRSQRPFGDRIHVDAGAFNGNATLSVFSECSIEEGAPGLRLSMSGDGTSFNVTGDGPNLPVTTNTGSVFIAEGGGGPWTDVVVEENNGDRESLLLGDVSCSGELLSVTVSGPGSVVSDPAGINCPGDCQASFSASESVSLTAAAERGAAFIGWSEPACGSHPVCTLSLDGPRTLSAEFEFPDSIFADEFN